MIFLRILSRVVHPQLVLQTQARQCHSVFNFKELIQPERAENFTIHTVTSSEHEMAVDVVKQHFLPEHAFVRTRNVDLRDCALDEYLLSLMKQGNALYAKAEDGAVAGVCVNFAASAVDPENLRQYAHYRQDPNIKDFLCFIAKLQETPNLWQAFNVKKVFEIKMLTVLPEYRRQGLAVALVDRAKEHATDQGYKIVRMDCINPYDYKVAERCMLQCCARVALHALRARRSLPARRALPPLARVYVAPCARTDAYDRAFIKQRQRDFESLIE